MITWLYSTRQFKNRWSPAAIPKKKFWHKHVYYYYHIEQYAAYDVPHHNLHSRKINLVYFSEGFWQMCLIIRKYL